MKKTMIVLAAVFALTACGGSSTKETSADSVTVDSTAAKDTTVLEGGKPAHEQPIK